MTKHDATEQAYKRGYEQGKRDAVVHGEWIPFHSQAAGDIQYCSNCEIGNSDRTSFCPHCGARMDGKDGAE